MPNTPTLLTADALQAVLDAEAAGIAVLRPIDAGEDFLTEYVNASLQALKPHVSMIGRTYRQVWPEVAERFIPPMRDVLASGEPWTRHDLPIELERPTGHTATAYYTFRVSRIETAGGLRLLSEVQDATAEVTVRKQAERELGTTRRLLAVSQALTERVDLQHVLSRLAEVVLASMPHTRSFVFTWDAESRMLTQAASAGLQAFPPGRTFAFDDLSAVTQEVVRSQRTALVDFDKLPPEQRGRALSAQGSHILVDVPVVWRGRLLGLIGVDDPGQRREFSDRDIELVEGIGAQAASAIETARLFEERAQALRSLEQKDRAIRQAYSDVIDAVTGGRLVILGQDELADALRTSTAESYPITEGAQLAEARRRLEAELADVPCLRDLTLAFSEGVTNMLKHAGGGRYRIIRDARRVQLVMSDDGPGIDFRDLPKATLLPGFSTKQTLGMGFTVMMQLADRLLLSSDSTGTTLVLEKDLRPGEQGGTCAS